MTSPLRRRSPAPPVRIAHLGLGAFARSHQAWWTDAVSDEWGIAAVAGRRPELVRALGAQGGLYTVAERSPTEDRHRVVGAVAGVLEAGDGDGWRALVAAPSTALLTLTVTEAAYRLRPGGGLDVDAPDVAADVAALRSTLRPGRPGPGPVGSAGTARQVDGRRGAGSTADALRSVPGRLVAGLAARRHADGGPMAVVPCDNLVGNGPATRRVVLDLAGAADPDLAEWIDTAVSFVSTVVDRITPATTDADRRSVATATGHTDAVAVVTEPWHEWVLAGTFPAGRPPWEAAGAHLVDDVGPWSERKLRLLNGGHSLLAYLGAARGLATVAEAVEDPSCRGWLDAWWAEAAPTCHGSPEDLTSYCASVRERFANARMAHRLDQIAAGGADKLAARVAPVLSERAGRGWASPAGVAVVAGWLRWLRSPAGAADPHAALGSRPHPDAARDALALLAPALADDAGLCADIAAAQAPIGDAPPGLLDPAGR